MKNINENILNILSKVTIEDKVVYLTCGTLDRKQYVAINEILETLGGKWNKKIKGHVFDNDPTEAIDDVLLTGKIEISNDKKDFQQYFTQPELAERVVDLADIEPHHYILEPSAGQGGILDFTIEYLSEHNTPDCVEIVPDNIKILKSKQYNVIHEGDFLTLEPNMVYDRIVMNPPFSLQQDISHVNHAWKFLKSGGRLVSIMSASVTFRDNKKTVEFRDFVNTYGYIDKNPDASFKSSGTMVNTVTVVLDKP